MTGRETMANGSLRKSLDEAALRRMAGDRSFSRGADCLADGRVENLSADFDMLTATVNETRGYRVKLWIEDGALEHSCTCSMGEGGNFCKHCVAAARAKLSSISLIKEVY